MIESLIRNMPSADLGALIQDIVAHKSPEELGNELKNSIFNTNLAAAASGQTVADTVATLLAGNFDRRSIAAVNRALGTDMTTEEVAAALEGSNYEVVSGRRGDYVVVKNVADLVLATFEGTEYSRRSLARVAALTGVSEATIEANAGDAYTITTGRSGTKYVVEA